MPGLAPHLVERRVNDAGVPGIEHHIDCAGVFVLVEHLLPGLAAIGSAEDAALRVRSPGVSESCDESDVGIAGIDDDCADVARVFEPDVGPCLAGIGGFVHSVTIGDVPAQTGFPAAGVKNVGIGIGYGDGADG